MTKKTLSLFLIALFFAGPSYAASLDLQSAVDKVGANSYFQVDVFLNSEDVSINTVQADISFPKDMMQLKEVRNGNSIVSFWVDQPKEKDGVISLSGIIPGGYNDKKGLVSSFIFESKDYGSGVIKFDNLEGYMNDGSGTPVKLGSSNLRLEIAAVPEEYVPVVMEDYTKPEEFVPEVNRSDDLFDGKYFLVFSTQDKGLGMDHYEVCEGNTDNCIEAESPYLISNQGLDGKIFVKAIDTKGNERIASLDLKKDGNWYSNWIVIVAIILSSLLIIYLIKKIWTRSKK